MKGNKQQQPEQPFWGCGADPCRQSWHWQLPRSWLATWQWLLIPNSCVTLVLGINYSHIPKTLWGPDWSKLSSLVTPCSATYEAATSCIVRSPSGLWEQPSQGHACDPAKQWQSCNDHTPPIDFGAPKIEVIQRWGNSNSCQTANQDLENCSFQDRDHLCGSAPCPGTRAMKG